MAKKTPLHPLKVPFEFNQISKYIYIGSNQCCVTHFDKKLVKKGVKADISLDDKKLDAPWGVKYFIWLPTINHRPPKQDQFKIGVQCLDSLVKNKTKVYVHCQRGHGRAPTLVAAYFIYKGMSVTEAINAIKKKRKVIHVTKSQVDALKRYKKSLKK